MSFANMIPVTVASGNSFVLPQGFSFASVSPIGSSTFNYTNNIGAAVASADISSPFTFPQLGSNTWDAHIITCVTGSIEISYCLTS